MTPFSIWTWIDAKKWGEICIHISAAIGIIGALLLFFGTSLVYAIAINTAFWAAWEIYQGIRDGKGANPMGAGWGWQKRFEMAFPIAAGVFIALAIVRHGACG